MSNSITHKNKSNKLKAAGVLFAIFFVFAGLAWFGLFNKNFDYKKGLDISGGSQLIFNIDTTNIPSEDLNDTLSALRDTIERRVNLFGVSEPVVYLMRGSFVSSAEAKHRLVVELPGVTDAKQAAEQIGKTPVLEFKMKQDTSSATSTQESFGKSILTGKHIQKAALGFTQQPVGEPVVEIWFNSEGAKIFADITSSNVGKVFGIFLDGELISAPVIQEPIYGGRAIISGNFTVEEAKKLARELNYGALPAPVKLDASQSIGASLGQSTLEKAVKAGVIGFFAVIIFLILYYRWLGILGAFSLTFYLLVLLALFKLIPVTITAAGLAGLILSLGMAVDANILIFERLKEELASGKSFKQAIDPAFKRAWAAIRDGNLSSLITAVILFWFGTSMIEGFALVFGLGVLVSMLSAVVVSKIMIKAFTDLLS